MERKKALVTGGSRGIGRGIVVCLARAGYDVVFSYNSKEEEAIETKQMAENAGGTCYYHQASLENPGVGQELAHTAIRELGGLDLLVNNAGITVFESILDLSWENVQRLTNLDFLNYLFMAKEAAGYMVEHKVHGSIINITSSRGQRAYPEDAVYGGIKAAINRASQSMALDLAPYKIRVNCVAPGAICIRTAEELKAENRTELLGFWEQLGPRIPMERNGTPEDIGNAVVWLADEKAGYITGEVLRVDGGLILAGMPEMIEPGQTDWGGKKRG